VITDKLSTRQAIRKEMQKRLARMTIGERRAARFAPPPPVSMRECKDGTMLPTYSIPRSVGFQMKGARRGRI
jgi:hypothetical protein